MLRRHAYDRRKEVQGGHGLLRQVVRVPTPVAVGSHRPRAAPAAPVPVPQVERPAARTKGGSVRGARLDRVGRHSDGVGYEAAGVLPRRPAPAGAVVSAVGASLLAGVVLIVLQDVAVGVSAVLVLGLLALGARRSRSAPAVDAVLMTGLLYLTLSVGIFGLWPLPGAVAVLAAWALARRSARAELWRSWCQRGSATPELPWLLLVTITVTAVALVTWQRVFDGQLPQDYVDAAAGHPLWLLALGGAGFSLLNAAVEEAVFRGVLQTAMERVSGPAVAIAAQATAFGALHVLGVPSGVVGAVMAGCWGVLLGVLRWRTRGLLAPYAAHVAADATIFLMLLPALT